MSLVPLQSMCGLQLYIGIVLVISCHNQKRSIFNWKQHYILLFSIYKHDFPYHIYMHYYLGILERGYLTPTFSPCGKQKTKDEISRGVFQLLVRDYGARPFGKLRIYPAASCQEVHQVHPMLGSGEYWISSNGGEPRKRDCNF